jgi:hypothetical protein
MQAKLIAVFIQIDLPVLALAKKQGSDNSVYGLGNCGLPTFPRSTVTEARGRVNVAPEPSEISLLAGGFSGSAWLFRPSECQTYCSVPKVIIATAPEKCWAGPVPASNATRTECAFD